MYLLRLALRPSPLFLLLLFTFCPGSTFAQVAIRPASSSVLEGESPDLVITGLQPQGRVTVHAFRLSSYFRPDNRASVAILAHARAVFSADGRGELHVDTAAPVEGTYQGADGLGLLWSGTRLSLDGYPGQPVTHNVQLHSPREILIRVETASTRPQPWIEARVELTDGADLLSIQDVSLPGLNGVFAQPKGPAAHPWPAIILLHGSEGGSTASARALAVRFAHLGYAAFALNYFAWPSERLTGIPQALMNIPVETLATARTWMSQQPQVDTRTVSLWGVSKGAEFALVAASYYPWLDRVIACVPSNVVWSGFGREPAPGEIRSSWTIGGRSLPFVLLSGYDDVFQYKFSSAYVHQRSLAEAAPKQLMAARIPLEKTRAKLLLLAAARDPVWPSAQMSSQIVASLQTANRPDIARAIVFPDASHYICGTGAEVRRIDLVHKPEGDDPTPEADAHAAATGWHETQIFLRR